MLKQRMDQIVNCFKSRSDEQNDRKMLVGTLSLLSARLVNILIGLIKVPLILSYLNQESYGLFLVIGQVAAWLAIADPQIGAGLINVLSKAEAEGDEETPRRALSSALAILLVAAVGISLFWALVVFVAPVASLFKLENASLQSQLNLLLFVSLAGPLIVLVSDVFPKLYTAYQEHSIGAASLVVIQLLSLFALMVCIRLDWGILGILLSFPLSMLVVNLLLGIHLIIKKPFLKPSIRLISFSFAKKLLSFGGKLMIFQMGWLMISATDQIIVSSQLGTEANASYGLAMKILGYMLMMPGIFYYTFWPACHRALEKGQFRWVRRRLMWIVLGTETLVLLAGGFLLIGGDLVMALWTHGKVTVEPSIWLALTVLAVLRVMQSPLVATLNAAGKVNRTAMMTPIAGVINLLLSLWWVQNYGEIGVICASIVASFVQLVLLCSDLRFILSPSST